MGFAAAFGVEVECAVGAGDEAIEAGADEYGDCHCLALTAQFHGGVDGTVKEVAEKLAAQAKRVPQALKRGHIFNNLTARLKSCPSRTCSNRSFSATS